MSTQTQINTPTPDTLFVDEEEQREQLRQKLNRLQKCLVIITSFALATSSILITLYYRILTTLIADSDSILPPLNMHTGNYTYQNYIFIMLATLFVFDLTFFMDSLKVYKQNASEQIKYYSMQTINNKLLNSFGKILSYFLLIIFVCLNIHVYIYEEEQILSQARDIISLKDNKVCDTNTYNQVQQLFQSETAFSNFCLFINRVSFCHSLQLKIVFATVVLQMIQTIIFTSINSISQKCSKKKAVDLKDIFIITINTTPC